MLERQLFLISVIGLLTIVSISDGYLMDRAVIPSLWSEPSPSNAIQNMSSGRIWNNNTHAIKMVKMSDDKIDTKHLEEDVAISPRKKEFETGSRNSEGFFLTGHNASSLNSSTSHLKNVILVLVDTVKQEREEFWKKFEKTYSFPVHGYFQVDNYDKNGPMKVDLNKYLFPEKKEDECECKETLRSNISELLTWAHQVKEMTTSFLLSNDPNLGVLSGINFSIPATPEIEETLEIVKNNESSESSTKGTIRKRQLQQNDSTHLMDSHERNNTDSPIIMAPNAKEESVTSYDDMWDVIDIFTKIRIAFFRAMIDTLSGPSNRTMADELSFQELPHLRTGFVNLVDGTLKNLETVSGDKGYVLVLAVPESELNSVIDLLHQQISLSDTLQIVTELCSKDTNRVPFFAKGPGASILYHTRAIGELADVIKSVVGRACQEHGCNKKQQPDAYKIPIRVIRDTIDSQNLSAVNNNDNISNKIHDVLTERMDTSSSSNVEYDSIITFLGMAMSLAGFITVNPS